jgi:hypothetical protein
MDSGSIISGAVAVGFALVHLVGGRLAFLRTVPRSAWLSLAGGVSVAYVFAHLLPELAAHQAALARDLAAGSWLAAIESHAYLVALAGLCAFYGLDRLARHAGRAARQAGRGKPALFWTHLGAFAAYNLLIGYLLVHREETDLRGLAIYAIALGLHFIVNDQGLRAHHGEVYDREGRWLLAVAPLLGWAIGMRHHPQRAEGGIARGAREPLRRLRDRRRRLRAAADGDLTGRRRLIRVAGLRRHLRRTRRKRSGQALIAFCARVAGRCRTLTRPIGVPTRAGRRATDRIS